MKWSRFVAIFSLAILSFNIATGLTARAEQRVALVIGNSKYRTVAGLTNPSNDADAMAKFFRGLKFDTVEARTDLDANSLRQTLRDFTAIAANADIAVVYYAGHGIEVGGTNYLVPVDAKLATDLDVEDEAVTLDRVLRAIEPARKLRLVILDACRDNPFLPKMRRVSKTRSIGRGLGEIDIASRDTLVAFAAKAGSTADDGDGRNSPFVQSLVSNLGKPGLDLRMAFGLVRDNVLSITKNRQEPWLYGTLGGALVSLAPDSGAASLGGGLARPITALPEDTSENDFAQAQRSNTREAWQAFLRIHPSGPLAERARDKLVLLTPAASAAPSAAAPSAAPKATSSQPSSSSKAVSSSELTDQAQLIYSPWTKFCLKDKDASAKQVCFTGKDARIESGMPVVAAVLIEPEGPDAKKVLRVTVPLGVQMLHGTRVIVDKNPPMQGPFVICFTNGCMADYDANPAMIASLKKGQGLTVQAINSDGQPISLVLPLGDFAKAYDGRPTDPKVFEEQQQKLQDELQKRAENAKRKLN
jgi:invasion protein IalB